ncbi:hypothetical protein GGF32_003482 [Allomyces javanicus]|nr:hypothetical protein GGF32_003482 [Allomyces javanicus]
MANAFTPLTQDELNILAAPSHASPPHLMNSPSPPAAVPSFSTSSAENAPVSGRIGGPATASTPAPAPAPASAGGAGGGASWFGATLLENAVGAPFGENEIRTFAAGDTLDEPVSVTLLRDLKAIGRKLQRVCFPRGKSDVLRDWDLWGPLLLCLALASTLSIAAPADQTAHVFTGLFVLVWAGAAVVTLNAKLLGGRISFFQSVCVLGYCTFPLLLASIIALFVGMLVVRGPIVALCYVWSTYASLSFLSGVNLAGRRLLGIYPVYLFFFVLAWMILIQP